MAKFGIEATGMSDPNLSPAKFISQGVQDNSKAMRTQANTGLIAQAGEMGLEAHKGYQLAAVEREDEKVIQEYMDRRDPNDLLLQTSALEKSGSLFQQFEATEEATQVQQEHAKTLARYQRAREQGVMSSEEFANRTLANLRTAVNKNPGLMKELVDHTDKVLSLSGITTTIKADQQVQESTLKAQDKIQTELRQLADSNNIKFDRFNTDYQKLQADVQVVMQEKGVIEAFTRKTSVTENEARQFGPTLAVGLVNNASNQAAAILSDDTIPLDKAVFMIKNLFSSVERDFATNPKIMPVIDKPSIAATNSLIKSQVTSHIENMVKYSTKEELKSYFENSQSIARNQSLMAIRESGINPEVIELLGKLSTGAAFNALLAKDANAAVKLYGDTARALDGLATFGTSLYDKQGKDKPFAVSMFNSLAIDAGKENGDKSVQGLSNVIKTFNNDKKNFTSTGEKFKFYDDYIGALGTPTNKMGMAKLDNEAIGHATENLSEYMSIIRTDFLSRVEALRGEGKTITLALNKSDGRIMLGADTSPEVAAELNGKYMKRINTSLSAYSNLVNASSTKEVALDFYKSQFNFEAPESRSAKATTKKKSGE